MDDGGMMPLGKDAICGTPDSNVRRPFCLVLLNTLGGHKHVN